MVQEQARDVGRVASAVADEVTGLVRDMHAAVADRWFGATGVLGRPVKLVHDAISAGVHGSVGVGVRYGLRLTAAGTAGIAGRADDLGATRRGNRGIAILNGILGDQLEDEAPSLEIEMAVRVDRRDVPVEPDAIVASFPDAGPAVAVFVHGLCENEESWYVRADRHHGIPEMCLSDRLERDHGMTGVHVRYNSGRSIAENGRSLHRLLTDLVETWPVAVERLILVGHSMGGLVIRSAEGVAAGADASWLRPLSHVICLGTPHRGAPLEKTVHLGTWLLDRLPEGRPFAGFLGRRSRGIRDLRFGAVATREGPEPPPWSFWDGEMADVPLAEGVDYHVVCATLGDGDGPLGTVLGDLLVRFPSASGQVARGPSIDFHGVHHLPRADHFDLLNHPEVHDIVSSVVGRDDSGR